MEQDIFIYIRAKELIELIKSLHAGFSRGIIPSHDQNFENDDRMMRGLYIYGSSVYENRISLLSDHQENSNEQENSPMERKFQQVLRFQMNPQKHNDIDLLCVRDEFYHYGMEDLIHPSYREMQERCSENRDVYMEQDVTLHFTVNGFYGETQVWSSFVVDDSDHENNSKSKLKEIPHKVQVEIHIMSTNLFVQCLRQHKGIFCQYLFLDHDTYILKEEQTMKWFRTFWFRNFHFHRRLMRRMMTREADIWCYSKARRHFTELPSVDASASELVIDYDIEKGKKNLIHGIRYYLFAKQMISSLTLYDWSVCNDLKKRVFCSSQSTNLSNQSDNTFNDSSWKDWSRFFDPLYKEHRETLTQQVQSFVDEALQLALRMENSQESSLSKNSLQEQHDLLSKPVTATPTTSTHGSLLLKIIEYYGLQYLSLNFGMDIIPILFLRNGQELSLDEGLTCRPLIQQLLEGLTPSAVSGTASTMDSTCHHNNSLKNYLHRINTLLLSHEKEMMNTQSSSKEDNMENNFSVLFKITQNKELERMEDSIHRKALREANGMIVEWNSEKRGFSIVAFPFLKFFDEFRMLNVNTKNKHLSTTCSSVNPKKQTTKKKNHCTKDLFSNISHLRKVYKKLTGKLFILYVYNHKWRISYKEEDEEHYFDIIASHSHHQHCANSNSWGHKFWKILHASKKTMSSLFESTTTTTNVNSLNLTKRNFMLQLLSHEERLVLIGVRNMETLEEEDLEAYEHVFEHIHREENITELYHEAKQLEQDLLYKNSIHGNLSENDQKLLLLLKLLYYKSNQLNPLRYSGYVCVAEKITQHNQTHFIERHRLKIESTFYYNLNELGIWNVSVNVQDNAILDPPNKEISHQEGECQMSMPNHSTTKLFNRWNGNLLSQNNELLLIEMAISMLGKTTSTSNESSSNHDHTHQSTIITTAHSVSSESEKNQVPKTTIEEIIFQREIRFNEKIKAFSPLYFQMKRDWEAITNLYDQFYEELCQELEKVEREIGNENSQNKFVAQFCEEKFSLENKTPIFKMVEQQCSHSREIFQSPRRVMDANSLVKIWKNYLSQC